MPVFDMDHFDEFPPVSRSSSEGIIGIGGDLSPDRLIEAYQKGIFPWYSEDEPIFWWSPDPRMVLFPSKLKVHKSMRNILNRNIFSITYDQDFEHVIVNCRTIEREGQEGTWITEDMLKAYTELHKRGYAHSVEVWQDQDLVGGLYGVAIGKVFFGESMFSKVSNASKTGFIHLVQKLERSKFELIDCQVYTRHLECLGAELIPRRQFLSLLSGYIDKDQGSVW